MRNRNIAEYQKPWLRLCPHVFDFIWKGRKYQNSLPCTAYFKINNNLDNRGLRLSMKILKQLQSLLSMMGVYQNLSPQQITKYEVYLHEHVHYHGDFIVFQKLSFHSSTQTQQHHNLKKKMPTLKQGSRKKKTQPVIWDKQIPFQASNCSCLHAHWAKSQTSHISIQSSWITDYFSRYIPVFRDYRDCIQRL